MITLYNTLTRKKEVFQPMQKGQVQMYVCGMTLYDYCHMGHARMLTAFDLIYRWFLASNYVVTYVRNITDIDDKIIQRAAENQEDIVALVARFEVAMNEDAQALNLLRPSFEPKATHHIDDMVAIIEQLIAQNKAYTGDNGDVYYAVRTFEGYGKLSGKTPDSLRSGERVDVDKAKRDPLDFVLWKAAKSGEPSWESPWGLGRPGWHIECSAMSCHHFGQQFDIHGGGEDLQFPHHENEIAQSEGASGHAYVNYWMHNGFINVDGEKMSKSLGNFFTIRDVLQHFDGEVIRFFIARTHYRSPVNFTDGILHDAKQGLTRLYTALSAYDLSVTAPLFVDWTQAHAARFKTAMDDDFNTAEAVAVLFDLASELNRVPNLETARLLKTLAGILGFLERTSTEFLQGSQTATFAAEIAALIEGRHQARLTKNWAESDRIRDALAAKNVLVEDSENGTTWRLK